MFTETQGYACVMVKASTYSLGIYDPHQELYGA
jgi:hypothetical protein